MQLWNTHAEIMFNLFISSKLNNIILELLTVDFNMYKTVHYIEYPVFLLKNGNPSNISVLLHFEYGSGLDHLQCVHCINLKYTELFFK